MLSEVTNTYLHKWFYLDGSREELRKAYVHYPDPQYIVITNVVSFYNEFTSELKHCTRTLRYNNVNYDLLALFIYLKKDLEFYNMENTWVAPRELEHATPISSEQQILLELKYLDILLNAKSKS